jgi:hypothetical protein
MGLFFLLFVLPFTLLLIGAGTAAKAAAAEERRLRSSSDAVTARRELERQQAIAKVHLERVELATYEPEKYNRLHCPNFLNEGQWPTAEAIARAKLEPRPMKKPPYEPLFPDYRAPHRPTHRSCGVTSHTDREASFEHGFGRRVSNRLVSDPRMASSCGAGPRRPDVAVRRYSRHPTSDTRRTAGTGYCC